jgi:hypothetical protein
MTSNKKPPGIIEFPAPKHEIPRPEPDTQRLTSLASLASLDDYIDNRMKYNMYRLMRAGEEINIQIMSEEEFDAFWARVMEDKNA